MDINLIPRDVQLLLAAAIVGIFVGAIHAMLGRIDSPIWPVRLYLVLLRYRQPESLRKYAASRTEFTWREQFMAAAFIWFFMAFIGMGFLFGCGRKTYC
ncbi:MAG: hypothetical protein V4488_08000 [Pseudomonadota bacterium]